MSVLFVIPAKAHSSRCPGKNTRLLGGVPLFLWTVQAALGARKPDDTVLVSTDEGPDGDEIARLATHEGAIALRRPPELCRDPAQLADVVLQALDRYEEQRGSLPTSVCALLPTSPFRTADHVREALMLHRITGENVVSVSDGKWIREKLHTYSEQALRMYSVVPDAYWWSDIGSYRSATYLCPHSTTLRMVNGAIWCATPERIRKDRMISPNGALPYVMDEESSLDIDSPLDFLVAEAIVAQRNGVAA